MAIRRALALLVIVAAACHGGSDGPTAPQSSSSTLVTGRLSGVVTIGPNCPVEQIDKPCPTSPDAYALRKVLVYDAQGSRLLSTVDIDSQGLYVIDLVPATYRVDLKKSGVDRASGVPTTVEIHANTVTKLDIGVDTGIR